MALQWWADNIWLSASTMRLSMNNGTSSSEERLGLSCCSNERDGKSVNEKCLGYEREDRVARDRFRREGE